MKKKQKIYVNIATGFQWINFVSEHSNKRILYTYYIIIYQNYMI